ncbi:hypothetical protein C8R43DRAFT_1132971 [Mycena crocata]|nr:hypothetical protein C8R43DRAFT_1132971 [Mycena crocata]
MHRWYMGYAVPGAGPPKMHRWYMGYAVPGAGPPKMHRWYVGYAVPGAGPPKMHRCALVVPVSGVVWWYRGRVNGPPKWGGMYFSWDWDLASGVAPGQWGQGGSSWGEPFVLAFPEPWNSSVWADDASKVPN